MTTAKANSRPELSGRAWLLEVTRFRRRDRLSQAESDALQGLGFDLLRLDRDRESPHWQATRRLTAPLDETLAVLHWCPDTVFQRRFARYATAIVLHHCGELGRDFWSWSTREWGDLLRPQQLRQRFAGQVGMQARPYLLAHAYLLAGFTAVRPGRAVRATYVGAESIQCRPRRGGDRNGSRGAGWLGIPRRESGVDDLHVTAAQPQPVAERSGHACAGQPALGSGD